MFRYIDSLLDRITMYSLLLYYLTALVGIAVILSWLGRLHYNPYAIVWSASYLTAVCWVSNKVFAYGFEAPASKQSNFITAMILALIISPATTLAGWLFLTAAGGLAMASKYMLAISRKHVFNPAAIAVVLTSLGAAQAASWWVGSASMLPFVAAGGLLLARKVQRFQMITSFIVSSYAATMIYTLLSHGQLMTTLQNITLNSALFFLAFVMLTEPSTSPATVEKQRWYGVLVGALFPPQVHIFRFYSTPELALVVGNIFSYFISPKTKLFPSLIQKNKLAPGIAEFVFSPGSKFSYIPGQYMEWTLPHTRSDSRGDRRYLTLASSPTESEIRLGVRFYAQGSSYKQAMLRMDSDTPVVASQLSGSFVLPDNQTRKLAFIAGGIGITPYRSMLKYLLDTGGHRDISVLYSAGTVNDFVYKDVLEAARRQLGVRVAYCLTRHTPDPPENNYRTGRIDAGVIRREVPDYADRLFYVSGSHRMVNDVKRSLRELGVHQTNVKVDFFPGYA